MPFLDQQEANFDSLPQPRRHCSKIGFVRSQQTVSQVWLYCVNLDHSRSDGQNLADCNSPPVVDIHLISAFTFALLFLLLVYSILLLPLFHLALPNFGPPDKVPSTRAPPSWFLLILLLPSTDSPAHKTYLVVAAGVSS